MGDLLNKLWKAFCYAMIGAATLWLIYNIIVALIA
jgi:hypothetical protein